ncbi:MAG: hypothetical protein JEY99_09250 [Spirochaetales bacterium]|nr:hypothetical protein [Spirochaetales bacterium]
MRIAYIVTSDISRFKGSTKKINGQVETWRQLGNQVEVFCRVPDLTPPLMEARRYLKPSSVLKNVLGVDKTLVADVAAYNPDALYIRQSFPNRTYFALQRRFRNVVEVVSNDWTEFKHLFLLNKTPSYFFKFILSRVLRGHFLKGAAGLAVGAGEFAQDPRFNRYCSETAVFPNSTALKDESEDILKGKGDWADGRCHLFFIGSPGFTWHGNDKLEVLADKLGDDFFIHIVGLEGADKTNLKYYGYLDPSEYGEVLSRAHICLGTFALHRKKQDECTTIKFCEYLKAGFPVILPYKETAVILNGKAEWMLEIPNREDVIDSDDVVEKIRLFCLEYRDRVVSHAEASDYIDSRVIEKGRLDFIERLCLPAKNQEV